MEDFRASVAEMRNGHLGGSSTAPQTIYCGDNLDKLRSMPTGFVDLVYIDPPFNSNRDYEVFWGETKEKRGFEDRHESTKAYIDFMRPRCVELRRVLKPTGSFYYHCDWHASHYVRVMLDQVFGESHFRSEIIWRRNHSKHLASTSFPNNHDNIYYYAHPDCKFNRPFVPYDAENLDEKTAKEYRYFEADGRRYCLAPLLNPNHDRPNLTYEFLGVTRVWRWTKERMQEAYEAGQVVQTSPGAVPKQKYYLDERDGRAIDDVWTDIQNLNNQTTERLGYPTQKPLSLLDRIIRASSDPGDLVLDAFCGCGTALVSAQNLGRRWIGIDVSPTACRVMADRLERDCKLRERKDFFVRDMPHSEEFLRRIPPFEFENWAVVALGGIPNSAKVGDMGIDGRIYPVSAVPDRDKAKAQLNFMDHWYPIQVKQKDKAGRPDIDSFEAVMMREERTKGFFVSFDFTSDAEREINAFFKRTGKAIIPLTVREIIDEEIAMKLA